MVFPLGEIGSTAFQLRCGSSEVHGSLCSFCPDPRPTEAFRGAGPAARIPHSLPSGDRVQAPPSQSPRVPLRCSGRRPSQVGGEPRPGVSSQFRVCADMGLERGRPGSAPGCAGANGQLGETGLAATADRHSQVEGECQASQAPLLGPPGWEPAGESPGVTPPLRQHQLLRPAAGRGAGSGREQGTTWRCSVR